MSIGALGAFAQGMGTSLQRNKDRKAKLDDDARMDRYLDIMERQPQQVSYGPGGMGAMPMGGEGRPGGGTITGDGTLFSLIDKTEGGGNYDTLFAHSQRGGRFDGVKVSEMTLNDLYGFSNPSGEYGQWVKGKLAESGHKPRVATPMGRHQIVGSTLRTAAAQMGLSPETKFTPQTQDAMASHLAATRLASAKTPYAKRAALRAEWEGFKHVSDAALDKAIANFEASGMQMRPPRMGAMIPR